MSTLEARDYYSIISKQMHDVGHMDPEVAEDLGFVTPDGAYDAVQNALAEQSNKQPVQPEVAKSIGGIMCGDCCDVVTSCAHLKVTDAGSVQIHG